MRIPGQYYELRNGLIFYHISNDENGDLYGIITRKMNKDIFTVFSIGDNITIPQSGLNTVYGEEYDIVMCYGPYGIEVMCYGPYGIEVIPYV